MSKKSLKGGEFERSFAKRLSLWYTEGERDDIFWRTAGSGARATTRRKSNVSTANSTGDIGYLDDMGKPLVDSTLIELKRGYSDELDLLKIMDSPKKKRHLILEWWAKAVEEAKESCRHIVWLVIRRDRCEPVIVISNETYYSIIEWNNKPNPDTLIMSLSLTDDVGCLKSLSLDAFFDWITPDYYTEG